ncbi:hypothetical protein D3C80_2223810 [compost metagenome]
MVAETSIFTMDMCLLSLALNLEISSFAGRVAAEHRLVRDDGKVARAGLISIYFAAT